MRDSPVNVSSADRRGGKFDVELRCLRAAHLYTLFEAGVSISPDPYRTDLYFLEPLTINLPAALEGDPLREESEAKRSPQQQSETFKIKPFGWLWIFHVDMKIMDWSRVNFILLPSLKQILQLSYGFAWNASWDTGPHWSDTLVCTDLMQVITFRYKFHYK